MESACRCALLVAALLVAGLVCEAATDYNILDFDLARRHELWMAEHGRVYKDEAEKAMRFEIFKDNVKYVEEFNKAGDKSYTLGVNQFTDLTTEEFANMYLGGVRAPTEREIARLRRSSKYNTMDELNPSQIPSSVDWRAEGAVTPVKHQRTCGSCWAFSTVAAVEGLHKIKKNVLFELSEQQLVDCDRAEWGCKGGYPWTAMDYIVKNGGLTLRSNYPYENKQNPQCIESKANATVVTISGRGHMPYIDEHALMGYAAKQPLVVLIEGNSTEFKQYDKGVYKGPCGGARLVNHAVTLVGYGEEGKDKYWIIKNSWGTGWGESGYVRLEKDAGVPLGRCGVASWPSWPKM